MSGICVAVKATTSTSVRSRKRTLKLWKSRPAAPAITTRLLGIEPRIGEPAAVSCRSARGIRRSHAPIAPARLPCLRPPLRPPPRLRRRSARARDPGVPRLAEGPLRRLPGRAPQALWRLDENLADPARDRLHAQLGTGDVAEERVRRRLLALRPQLEQLAARLARREPLAAVPLAQVVAQLRFERPR